MKLPTRGTSPVQQSTPSVTPGQVVQAAQSELGIAQSIVDTSVQTYQAVAATAVSHAETRAAREYADRWGAVKGKEFIPAEELDAVGVEYDPNMAEQQTSAGPDGAPVEKTMLPTWAVSEAYHKRIVGDIRDAHTPAVNDMARNRFLQDYDTKYGTQAQAQVGIQAAEQRVTHQRGALDRDTQDLMELGDYGQAMTIIARARAAGVLNDEQYATRTDKVLELKEVSGYEDVIVNGDLDAQQRLYDELAEGIEPNSERYNGELTVPERRPYINRLAMNMKAARERTSSQNTAGFYLKAANTAAANGDTLDPRTARQIVDVVTAEGTATQQLELDKVMTRLSDTEVLYGLDAGSTEQAVNAAQAAAGGSVQAVNRADNMRKAAEAKAQQYKRDPQTFAQQYGPDTKLKNEAARAVDVSFLMRNRPAEVAPILAARSAYAGEISAYYGQTGNVLTEAEAADFRGAYLSGGLAERMSLVQNIAATGAEPSKAVFDQLAATGTVEGYAMPAAAAALNAGSLDGARMIIQSADAMKDPEVKSYAQGAELRRAVYKLLPPGMELTVGSQGRLNFAKALTNLYAYQAAQQGLDPVAGVDTDLLTASLALISGGNVTDYGRTRVKPPKGQTVAGMTELLEDAPGDFWQSKIDEGDYRFSAGGANVTGEGLRQRLASGSVWLSPSLDGSDGYTVMTYVSEPGSADFSPSIARDDLGAPLVLHFDDADFGGSRAPVRYRQNTQPASAAQ